MCKNHMLWGGLLILVVGVLFLLRDLNVWNFWNIQGWSILFLLIGCKMLHLAKEGSSCCVPVKPEAKKKK